MKRKPIRTLVFKLFKGENHALWYWQVASQSGEVLVECYRGYDERGDALALARRVLRLPLRVPRLAEGRWELPMGAMR